MATTTAQRISIIRKVTISNVLRAVDVTLNGEVHLDLSSTRIGDEEARIIANTLRGNTNLTHLNLFGNQIGDEGTCAIADALQGNTSLRGLYLGDNIIGDKGARALADVLRGNTALRSLVLFGNRIGDEGVRALADALRVNVTLRSIGLQVNLFRDEGACALAEVIEDGNACAFSEDEMRVYFYERIGCYAANVLRRYVRGGNRSLTRLHVDASPATCERIDVALAVALFRYNKNFT